MAFIEYTMFIFGHLGVTLGFFFIIGRLVPNMLHLAQHRMWTKPVNLLWPLFGWKFPSCNPEDWLNYFRVMFWEFFAMDFSYVFISEAIGFITIMLSILGYLFSRAKANQ